MTQKEKIVTAYITECLSATDLEEVYNLLPGAVVKFSRQIHGDGFRVMRKINLRKRLDRLYGFTYWPYDYGQ